MIFIERLVRRGDNGLERCDVLELQVFIHNTSKSSSDYDAILDPLSAQIFIITLET